MSTLHLTLLGFAFWTLAVLALTVGVHRWSRILTGRGAIHQFPADAPEGPDWYKRATRAHANCVENLPVYAAIVVAASAAGAEGTALDTLGVVLLGARVGQTVTHVGFVQTARAVTVRFTLFSVQLVAMLVMIVLVAAR